MEVHHHPQLEHKPKPWKEYILEGLMIFFAVMLGFFAESLRENIADKSRVHELTASLVKELKDDTTRLSYIVGMYELKIKQMDSLYYLIQRPDGLSDPYKMHQLIQSCSNVSRFTSESGTIAELKNSGFLRLLAETEVPHYIGLYESTQSITSAIETTDGNYEAKYIDVFMSQHFTPANLMALSRVASSLKDTFKPVDKNFRSLIKQDLVQFSADLMLYKINSEFLLAYYKRDKTVASDFMKYVQGKYNLKDE